MRGYATHKPTAQRRVQRIEGQVWGLQEMAELNSAVQRLVKA